MSCNIIERSIPVKITVQAVQALELLEQFLSGDIIYSK
jgi:hypothetical protein